MALNPQLVSVAQAYGGSSTHFPAPYAGEFICCSRDGVHFEIKGDRPYKFSGAGTVFLTNYRLVFVAQKPTPDVRAVELPLLFVENEDVSQPILWANNLNGLCQPVTAPPNSSQRFKWKLTFRNGGMGTLVPMFYASLAYLRAANRNRRTQEQAMEAYAAQEAVMQPPEFVQQALLDPSDPTKVYLVQPVGAADKATEDPRFPLV